MNVTEFVTALQIATQTVRGPEYFDEIVSARKVLHEGAQYLIDNRAMAEFLGPMSDAINKAYREANKPCLSNDERRNLLAEKAASLLMIAETAGIISEETLALVASYQAQDTDQ